MTSIDVINLTIYFLTNLSTSDEPSVITSTDHKLIHPSVVFKNRVAANVAMSFI